MVCMHNRLAAHSILCAGRKRKRGDEEFAEMLANICEKADEKAAEREERLRLRELEMEEGRIERENRHEERILSMFAALLERSSGSSSTFLQGHYYPHPPSYIFIYILMIHDYTHHYHIINIIPSPSYSIPSQSMT